MPHMVYCGRYYRFSTDEFSIPGFLAILARIFWCTLLSACLALIVQPLYNCNQGGVLIAYFAIAIFINILSILCEIRIVVISTKGTMISEISREGLIPYITLHLILAGAQLGCAIFGLCVFAQYTDIPCSSDIINSTIVYSLLLTAVITQVFDTMLFSCCFGYIYRWRRVQFKSSSAYPRRPSIMNDAFAATSKRDLAVFTEDPNIFNQNMTYNFRSICKCLQFSTCNLFGGGNIGEDLQVVANVLTPLFHHEGFLDVVPSDIIAGIILVRMEQRNYEPPSSQMSPPSVVPSARGIISLVDSADTNKSTASLHERDLEKQQQLSFIGISPPVTLEYHRLSSYKRSRVAHHRQLSFDVPTDFETLKDISYYAKFSLALYTQLLYIYVKPFSGACKLCFHSITKCTCCGVDPLEFHVAGDNCCRFNQVALMRFTKKLGSKCIHVSFENSAMRPPYAVFADKTKRTIIIAIRGTLSLEDAITDINAEVDAFEYNNKQCFAHRGFLQVALYVQKEIESHDLIQKALNYINHEEEESDVNSYQSLRNNSYQVVCTGHSMGAASAVVLTFLLRSKYPQCKCIAFGTPGSTVDKETALQCSSFITSVCLGSDIVCRLSLASLCLLREQILDAISRAKVNKVQIIQSLFKDYNLEDMLYPKNQAPETEFKRDVDEFTTRIKEQLAKINKDMQYSCPGRIIHFAKLKSHGHCCTKVRQYAPLETSPEEFEEIQVSPTMVWDHFPNRYVEEIDKVLSYWLSMRRNGARNV